MSAESNQNTSGAPQQSPSGNSTNHVSKIKHSNYVNAGPAHEQPQPLAATTSLIDPIQEEKLEDDGDDEASGGNSPTMSHEKSEKQRWGPSSRP